MPALPLALLAALALACRPAGGGGGATAVPGASRPLDGEAAEPPPLPPLGALGPAAPGEWAVRSFLPGPSADTITLKSREEGFALAGTIVQASARTAMICYQNGGPYRGIRLADSILRVEPGTLPLDRSYWGLRGYDVVDLWLERVEIAGFGAVTPKHDEGHAIYLNLAGPLTLEGCVIHHNGGQGLQLVNRPKESVLPPGPAAGAIAIRRSAFRENGFNPDRGATQVSIFGTGQAILLEDVEIVAGRDGTPFPGGRTGGALLIEAEAPDGQRPVWWRPAEGGAEEEIPFAQGRCELIRVRIDHADPNRPLVQIKGCAELVVRDCRFAGGRVEIDLPGKPGRDCGRIEWEGNGGPAEVFVRGRRMGSAAQDFVIE
ncbi:MAG: hypothetical protein AB1726_09665 [Planctomycetota bacterium]